MNNRKKICEVLCGRIQCNENIIDCVGYKNKRCRDLKKSFILNMNDNQVEYVVSEIRKNTFLQACPGSGKTEVLAIKTAYEMKKWSEKTQGIAVLTFTNSAEEEIVHRLDCYINNKMEYPHFIGTFTSWLHGYIAQPFLHLFTEYEGDSSGDKKFQLIDNNCTSKFLFAYQTKYSYGKLNKIKATEFYYDFKQERFCYCGTIKIGDDILSELLVTDTWRSKELDDLKQRFWKAGFATYEDVEGMVYQFLVDNPHIAVWMAKRFPILFIDECQDLSYIELKIIETLISADMLVHFIGDLNQSIYGFRNIEPRDTEEYIQENNFRRRILNENYRSCQSIVDISQYIVNDRDCILGKNEKKVDKPLIAILYSEGEESKAVETFKNHLENDCFEDCRIIVRTNNLKNKLLGIKNQGKSLNNLEMIAKATYLFDNIEASDNLIRSFEILAQAIQRIFFNESSHLNKQYLYRPIELEAVEWKGILFKVKEILENEEELKNYTYDWKKWKKCLNIVMENKVKYIEGLEGSKYSIGNIRPGNLDKSVAEIISTESEGISGLPIETIHGCKGMSLDAVLFVSSYKKSTDEHSGGYWKQWFDLDEIGEENRLAYVAFSRARYLLALAIPKPKKFSSVDGEILVKAGFEIIES